MGTTVPIIILDVRVNPEGSPGLEKIRFWPKKANVQMCSGTKSHTVPAGLKASKVALKPLPVLAPSDTNSTIITLPVLSKSNCGELVLVSGVRSWGRFLNRVPGQGHH